MALEEYKSKRDFKKTPEPSESSQPNKKDKRIFVIQKHDATRLHYDFRIELNGVLKSWAVPKGPSLNPSTKRLAIMTEDHPYDYAEFEGVIPENQYGTGEVINWDNGTYENITEKNGEIQPLEEAIAKGHFLIELHGERLNSGFAMTRIQKKSKDKQSQWLLVKMDDSNADEETNITEKYRNSVKSGKSLEDLKKEDS